MTLLTSFGRTFGLGDAKLTQSPSPEELGCILTLFPYNLRSVPDRI